MVALCLQRMQSDESNEKEINERHREERGRMVEKIVKTEEVVNRFSVCVRVHVCVSVCMWTHLCLILRK